MNILLSFLNLRKQNAFFVYSPPISEAWTVEKDLLNTFLRVTMHAVRGTKNAPRPSREAIFGKGQGVFLTT